MTGRWPRLGQDPGPVQVGKLRHRARLGCVMRAGPVALCVMAAPLWRRGRGVVLPVRAHTCTLALWGCVRIGTCVCISTRVCVSACITAGWADVCGCECTCSWS